MQGVVQGWCEKAQKCFGAATVMHCVSVTGILSGARHMQVACCMADWNPNLNASSISIWMPAAGLAQQYSGTAVQRCSGTVVQWYSGTPGIPRQSSHRVYSRGAATALLQAFRMLLSMQALPREVPLLPSPPSAAAAQWHAIP